MLPLLAPILTQLAGAGLQKVADAVMDKGMDYVEDKLGIKLEPDNTGKLPAETVENIKAEALKHEEFMFELEIKDKDSARRREVDVANSGAGWLSKNIVPLLALGTIVFSFGLTAVIAFTDVVDDQKDLLIYALGFASSASTMVLGYYFGSSQGSKDKSNELKAFIK